METKNKVAVLSPSTIIINLDYYQLLSLEADGQDTNRLPPQKIGQSFKFSPCVLEKSLKTGYDLIIILVFLEHFMRAQI